MQLRELGAASWISARSGSAYDEMLLSACRTIGGFEPDVRHRADNTGVIVQLTAAGAVAIVSSLGWPDARTGTVLRPLAGVRIEREIFTAAHPASSERPTIAALREALRGAWEEFAPAPMAHAADRRIGRATPSSRPGRNPPGSDYGRPL